MPHESSSSSDSESHSDDAKNVKPKLYSGNSAWKPSKVSDSESEATSEDEHRRRHITSSSESVESDEFSKRDKGMKRSHGHDRKSSNPKHRDRSRSSSHKKHTRDRRSSSKSKRSRHDSRDSLDAKYSSKTVSYRRNSRSRSHSKEAKYRSSSRSNKYRELSKSPNRKERRHGDRSESPKRKDRDGSRTPKRRESIKSESPNNRAKERSRSPKKRHKDRSKSPKRKDRICSPSQKKKDRSKSPRSKGRMRSPTRRNRDRSDSISPIRKDRYKSKSPIRREKDKGRSPSRRERNRSSSPGRRERNRSRSPKRRGRSRSPRRRSRDRYSHRRYKSSSRSSSRELYRRRKSRTPPRIRRKREFLKTLHAASAKLADGALNQEKPSNLPLSGPNAANIASVTPQLAVQHAMAAMNAKAEAMTGISLPKYYNPAAVNPIKYAEQVQKRKLLWKNKTEMTESISKPTTAANWEQLSFTEDQDGKQAAKFKKLMGIKDDDTSADGENKEKSELLEKQKELFKTLDQQYEVARMSTHTHRGVGLGFSSHIGSQPTFPR